MPAYRRPRLPFSQPADETIAIVLISLIQRGPPGTAWLRVGKNGSLRQLRANPLCLRVVHSIAINCGSPASGVGACKPGMKPSY